MASPLVIALNEEIESLQSEIQIDYELGDEEQRVIKVIIMTTLERILSKLPENG